MKTGDEERIEVHLDKAILHQALTAFAGDWLQASPLDRQHRLGVGSRYLRRAVKETVGQWTPFFVVLPFEHERVMPVTEFLLSEDFLKGLASPFNDTTNRLRHWLREKQLVPEDYDGFAWDRAYSATRAVVESGLVKAIRPWRKHDARQ